MKVEIKVRVELVQWNKIVKQKRMHLDVYNGVFVGETNMLIVC